MKQKARETLLRAFVLMPFEPEFDKIFSDLIKLALEKVGYDVKRADSIDNQQNILKDVVRGIAGADLVVVDLTGLNPNVLYELGIAHTMQKPTVLLTQSREDVPFDLKSYRVIQYSARFHEAPQLSQALKKIGQKAKGGDLGFGNPVGDFLPQISELKTATATKAKKVVTEVQDKMKVKHKEEEKGLWDFVVDGERSMKDITECTERMAEATQKIGKKMQRHTEQVQKITQTGMPGTAARVYRIAAETASDMILYAEKLEEEQPKFHNAWESFDKNITGLLQTSQIHNERDKKEGLKFCSQVNDLRSQIRNALQGIRSYRQAIENLRGISRDVNRASKRTAHALNLVISDLEGGDSYCTKVITLLDEKLEREG